MKVPNKIYAGFDENTHLESYCTKKKGRCQTEYIRKDALLEWAKEMYLNENASAIRKVCYKQLIDKLNLM